MELRILSSLEKVFSDEKPSAPEFKSFSMFKNERSSFQAAFCTDENCELAVELSGELASCSKVYLVKDVPVGRAAFDDADDFYLKKNSGMYPDCLEPVEGSVYAEKGKWYSLWVEIIPGGKTGKSDLCLELFNSQSLNKSAAAQGKITVDVLDKELPKQELIYTCWYHSDCICNYYGIEAMSDEYWRINENFIKMAAEHGMNCILTPVFTPPLDTKVGGERTTVQLVKVYKNGSGYRFDFRNLKKWVEMCSRCGIEYFEISHLFTQWGAKHAPKIIVIDKKGRKKKAFGWKTRTSSKKYDRFLSQFAAELIKFIDENGLRDKCFFHVSDEPHMRHLRVYRKRAELIRRIFPGFTVIDALSDFDFYKTGAVTLPIPCESDIEDFAGKVPELWTYYCCGQGRNYLPNRFIAMPSMRNRVLGTLLYKYDCKGFLQWGYNFYNSQYSIRPIDPFKVTDAGGGFPSGDSFVVYPAADGEPLASLRLKVFYDGFQDLAALRMLESKIGREKTAQFLEKECSKPLSFTEYPRNTEWLLNLREQINRKIMEN